MPFYCTERHRLFSGPTGKTFYVDFRSKLSLARRNVMSDSAPCNDPLPLKNGADTRCAVRCIGQGEPPHIQVYDLGPLVATGAYASLVLKQNFTTFVEWFRGRCVSYPFDQRRTPHDTPLEAHRLIRWDRFQRCAHDTVFSRSAHMSRGRRRGSGRSADRQPPTPAASHLCPAGLSRAT